MAFGNHLRFGEEVDHRHGQIRTPDQFPGQALEGNYGLGCA